MKRRSCGSAYAETHLCAWQMSTTQSQQRRRVRSRSRMFGPGRRRLRVWGLLDCASAEATAWIEGIGCVEEWADVSGVPQIQSS